MADTDGMYIQSVSLSKDNRLLATTCFTGYHERVFVARVPSGEDARLWDTQTGEELLHLPLGGVKATVSSNGEWLVCVGTGARQWLSHRGCTSRCVTKACLDVEV